MSMTLTLLTTTAGLLVVLCWWVRRNNLAVYPAGRAPRELRSLSSGCELGTALLAASTDTATGATGSQGGTATSPPPAQAKAPRRQKRHEGPSRRDFLRFGLLASMGGTLAAFAGASLGFLWPTLKGGFGARLDIGSEADIAAGIAEGGGHFEYPAGRSYIVAYDAAQDPNGAYAEVTNGAPFMALYQKCVHLGCRVPWCATSKWWECPCHGSRYNRWGEYQFGPAPRGLDRFSLTIEQGRVIVDTSTVVTGPSRGSGAPLNQAPEGPHCDGS
ncbi:MAG: Rieske 2Fe-2S domain-containing protein [Euzebyaceae bacterium]|jgi:cytochrome b6-f complex iron-sulfur subunit|nr:Rieske 2Fe-2S domain-containing protein [Euzebyaceae bacterium]